MVYRKHEGKLLREMSASELLGDPRRRALAEFYFGHVGATLREAGKEMGISSNGVRYYIRQMLGKVFEEFIDSDGGRKYRLTRFAKNCLEG